MAAVTVVKCRPVTPPGYEVNDKGTLTEDVVAGNLLSLGSSGWSKCPTDQVEPDGIALQDGYSGQANFPVGIHGEMDGFSGLTPGAKLYPSGSVAGDIDTTAPTYAATTPAVPAVAKIKAANTTRIRYNFV
jgi:hypothetical protein